MQPRYALYKVAALLKATETRLSAVPRQEVPQQTATVKAIRPLLICSHSEFFKLKNDDALFVHNVACFWRRAGPMSGGLIALLDDVAAIAKVAAASVDDVGAAALKASTKAVGVVVDDTAVTPTYVQGFAPARELPIIGKIARGSLVNKAIILPAALLLSQFVPALLTPLLMLGGLYLCYEGAEKLYEAVTGHGDEHSQDEAITDPVAHEKLMVSGAIRTDFILSAEIMVIALAEVASEKLLTRALSLAVVALLITAVVYGLVAIIVKMDDVGLHLASSPRAATRSLGLGLVRGMPVVMNVLSVVGTAAMLWVGGHILEDGLDKLGWHWPAEALHHAAHLVHDWPMHAAFEWLLTTALLALFGTLVGGVVVAVLHLIPGKKAH